MHRRFIWTVVAAFSVSQVFAIVIHGFILGPDYRPFYGTLLRPGLELFTMLVLGTLTAMLYRPYAAGNHQL